MEKNSHNILLFVTLCELFNEVFLPWVFYTLTIHMADA